MINLLAFSNGVGLDEWIECLVGPRFGREALFVYGDDSLTARSAIDDNRYAAARIRLVRSTLTETERDDYVRFARLVDDGEAQAISIARHRGLPLLTDDTAGHKLGLTLGISIISSLDVAVEWSMRHTRDEVRRACRRLRRRARFAVPYANPHAGWYRAFLDESREDHEAGNAVNNDDG